MVAFWLVEFCFFLVGDGLFVFGAVEDVLDRQHTDDGEDFVGALERHGHDQHFREVGF